MYAGGTGTPTIVYSGLTHEIGDYPWGLAVTTNGNVFISTDFTSAGGFIIKLTKSGSNYTASTFQSGHNVATLAVDVNDNLYTIEDPKNNGKYQIVKYPANTATGTILYKGLVAGAGYAYPTGLVIAPNGDIYVADAFSNTLSITDGGRVYKLTRPQPMQFRPYRPGITHRRLPLMPQAIFTATKTEGRYIN
jgi:hypothetical protein